VTCGQAEAVVDLMAATRTVGDHEIVGSGLAQGREQRQLGHGQGHVDGLGAVAEGAGHAAAARLDRADIETGHRTQDRLHRTHGGEGFLVAMAVEMGDPAALVGERQVDASGLEVGGEQLLEQEARAPELGGLGARKQRGELVPEGEEAGRLEADDPGAGADERQQRGQGAPGLGAGPVGLARCEVGPPAAERAAAAMGEDPVQAVAGREQHPLGRLEVLALEGPVEGVAEQDDVAEVAADVAGMRRLAGFVPGPTPLRQGPAGREADPALGQPGQGRQARKFRRGASRAAVLA
jgi:hypothetical protein